MRERIILEHLIHAAAPNVDDVGLLTIGIVFTRTTSVPGHLSQITADAHREADTRNNVPVLAVRLAGKLHIQLTVCGNPPAIGAAHTEIKYRRGDNRLAGDEQRIFGLLKGKVAQMLLHYLYMIWLPEAFELLLVVIYGWFEEINLRLAGNQLFTIDVPANGFTGQL